MGCMNIRRVQRDIPINPITPQNTNIAGGRGHERNPALGRRTFIDDMVDRISYSTRACHQESLLRRSLVTPGVAASVSIVESIGEAATPLGIPAKEYRVSIVGSADQDLIYHINKKVVTEEEWT